MILNGSIPTPAVAAVPLALVPAGGYLTCRQVSRTGQLKVHYPYRRSGCKRVIDVEVLKKDYPKNWCIPRGAPKNTCTVNITPRRLQRLKTKPGEKFTWTNTSLKDGKQVQSGTAEADKYGLVTMENVIVTKDQNRIRLVRRH